MDFVENNDINEQFQNTPKKKYSEITIDDVKLRKITQEDIDYAHNAIKGALDRLKDM